jgi:signal transduction histidine kinase
MNADSLRQQADIERLEAAVASQDEQIAMLSQELEETNRGVVALYAELDDRAEQLRHISDLKSRFLSYLSHEFRTPLGSMRSITRILLDRMDGPLTEEQERQIEFVQAAAAELSNMVDDLLDLARVEAGRITISPEWFDMMDLMAALRGMFKPIVTNSAVNLIFEEPPDIPRIYTDHRKLSQILRNFISNALKFTPQGEVSVSARYDGEAYVTFSVSDTGIGIAKEHLPLLFMDFTQIDSPIQRQLRGAGLGLSLCKRFAELLGGSVAVESEPGSGSTFHTTIPIRLTLAESESPK